MRRRRSAVVVLGGVAVALAVVLAAWWLLRGDGDAPDEADDATLSTSSGPVEVTGDLRIQASVPPGAVAPTSCDEWSQVLRIEVQTASGQPLDTFAPGVRTDRDAERSEQGSTLDCELDYTSRVPDQGDYAVAVVDVRAGGRAAVTVQVEGAERGQVRVPALQLAYTCDTSLVCTLRPST